MIVCKHIHKMTRLPNNVVTNNVSVSLTELESPGQWASEHA